MRKGLKKTNKATTDAGMRVLARTSRACACVRVKPERLQITIISRRYSSGGRTRSICRWRSDVW